MQNDPAALFEAVGASAADCDTIPGRTAMASAHFMQRAYGEANVYLASVKPYLHADEAFCLNSGVALAASGAYKDAEEALLRAGVADGAGGADAAEYRCWLARCHIMCRRPQCAWELYLQATAGVDGGGGGTAADDDASSEGFFGPQSPDDAARMLRVIAHDSYKTGAFLFVRGCNLMSGVRLQ